MGCGFQAALGGKDKTVIAVNQCCLIVAAFMQAGHGSDGSELAGNAGFDFVQRVHFDFVVGLLQGVGEAFGIGAAVAFNHHAAQAEEDGAVKAARIQALLEVFECGQSQ